MNRLFTTLGAAALALATFTAAPARAQTTANGPYYATPSWDQKLQCDTQATCPRFVVLSNWNNEAVLDRETGIVWERTPSPINSNWTNARSRCNTATIGNRKGWRLPSIQELATLVDADPSNVNNPRLPVGHPFLNILVSVYWSATIFIDDSTSQPTGLGWHLILSSGTVGSGSNRSLTNFAGSWCMRGGPGMDVQ